MRTFTALLAILLHLTLNFLPIQKGHTQVEKYRPYECYDDWMMKFESFTGWTEKIMQGILWTLDRVLVIKLLFAVVIFRFIFDPVFVDSKYDAGSKS